MFSAVSQGFWDFETGRQSKSYPVVLATFAASATSAVVFCVLRLVIKSRIPFDVSVIRDGVFMGLSAGPMGLVSAAGGLELVPPIIFDSSIGQTPFPCAVYGNVVDIHWVICGQSVGKWRPLF